MVFSFMPILSNNIPDSRYGGNSVGGKLEPIKKDNIPAFPEVNLQPFQQRWSMMRLEAMSKWYRHWRDLSRYINPKRGHFEGFVPNYNAQYDYRLIMDGDPADYARVMATGLASGLTSPSRPWFKLTLQDPNVEASENVRIWLDDVQKLLLTIFEKSNFYDSCQQTYEELGLFGTGAFGIYEDVKSVIRCRSYTIGEYYLGTDNTGRVNSFARQYWMTCDQVVSEFGWENCSDMVKNTYKSGMRDTFVLIYTLCEPNTAKVDDIADYRGKAFRSLTWEAQAVLTRALKISGYNEFPVMAPRWEVTTTADIYGVGPGWYALGDIKSLYRMEKDSLLAINKMADPPLQVDASVEGTINTLPGGITRSNSQVPNAGVRAAYMVQPDINALEAKIQKKKDQISARFYADLFKMMIDSDRKDITAREVEEKHSEKLLLLGPVVGRMQADLHGPAIERTFAICLRNGLVPPPPPEIQGMPLKVEYISLLAQAQRSVGATSIEQEAQFVGALSQVFPEAVDNFNPDEAVREHAVLMGTPQRIIRSEEAVAEIRQQRAQQQASQQQMEQAQQASVAAKNLSQAKIGPHNALETVAGIKPGLGGQGIGA